MRKILVSYQVPEPALEGLKEDFELICPTNKSFTYEEIAEKIVDCEALMAVNIKVDQPLIDQAKALKIIANYGAGYDNIDVAYATSKGIVVTNTPDAVAEATAELTFGLMSCLLRNIAFCDRQLRYNPDFRWGMLLNYTGRSLYGKTLGIVGMGNIGRAVARRAVAAKMKIIYHNRHRIFDAFERELSADYVSLPELLQSADVVTLHTPLNDTTHHLIGQQELDMMKPDAYLINTSRGAVVDEEALVRQMKAGKLTGAALDVFEHEPSITDELLQMDNVLLTPHIGTETHEARIEMGQQAAANLLAFFQQKLPPNAVN